MMSTVGKGLRWRLAAAPSATAAAGAVEQGLHTADDPHRLVGLQRGPARRGIHAVGAAAMDIGTVEQDVELRLGLATDDRLEAAPTEAAHVDTVDLAQKLAAICRCASCT